MKQEKDRNERLVRGREQAMKAKAFETVSNKARLLFHLKDRNREIYQQDNAARALYQSRLCEAIKTLARTNERTRVLMASQSWLWYRARVTSSCW